MVDYIEKINANSLDSEAFDGQHTSQTSVDATVFTSQTFTADLWKTYSLASYIPDDGYDYEVQFEVYTNTGTTSGNATGVILYSGTATSSNNGDSFAVRVTRTVTRASSTQIGAGVAIVPIKGSDRKITYRNADASGTSGNHSLYIRSMKRLGSNLLSTSTKYVSNISNGTTRAIGGNLLSGQWVSETATIASGISLAAGANSSPYSLASYLPDDGQKYEVLLVATGATATSSGNNIALRVGTSSTTGSNPTIGRQVTRTSSNMIVGGQVKIVVGTDRKVYVGNGGSSGTISSVNFYIRAYRRIGTSNSMKTNSICIPSDTLIPNTLIYGSPTITNGIASNFTSSNYLQIAGNKSTTNAEYVVKFTIPSAISATSQSILHSQHLFSIEVVANTFNIDTYNWETQETITLFTANAGTTYWTKVKLAGTSKIYSYSTDGVLCKLIQSVNHGKFVGATYDGTQYVYVTERGYTNTSVDGITWTGEASSNLPDKNNNKLIYINSYYFVGNRENLYRSSDLSNWSISSILSNDILDMASDGTNILALTEDYKIYLVDPTTGLAITSFNVQMVSSTGNYKYFQYGNNTYVVLTDKGYAIVSTDGINWSTSTQIANYIGWQSLAFDGEKFYAFPESAHKEECYTSTDGITWTLEYVYTPFRVQNCVFTNDMFLFGESDIYKGIVATGGQDYIDAITMTDSLVDATEFYPIRLGNCSLNRLLERSFSGTIDLNECYININGVRVWNGMDFKKYLPVGGYIADGQWVKYWITAVAAQTFTSGTHSFTVTGYLPENNVQYEVLAMAYGRTGSSSGNTCSLWLDGSQTLGSPVISYVRTRSASSTCDERFFTLICTQIDNKITFTINNTSNVTTGSCSVFFTGYRRIGNNT